MARAVDSWVWAALIRTTTGSVFFSCLFGLFTHFCILPGSAGYLSLPGCHSFFWVIGNLPACGCWYGTLLGLQLMASWGLGFMGRPPRPIEPAIPASGTSYPRGRKSTSPSIYSPVFSHYITCPHSSVIFLPKLAQFDCSVPQRLNFSPRTVRVFLSFCLSVFLLYMYIFTLFLFHNLSNVKVSMRVVFI